MHQYFTRRIAMSEQSACSYIIGQGKKQIYIYYFIMSVHITLIFHNLFLFAIIGFESNIEKSLKTEFSFGCFFTETRN